MRKEGAAQSHHDFLVRRSCVLTALQWLQLNNIYYHSVTINTDALALLPEDGDLSDLTSVTLESTSDNSNHKLPAEGSDPYDACLARTFIPISGCQRTEQVTIRQSVLERRSDHPPTVPPMVMWPSTAATPVNEFSTEGYISCAFPALFPTGAADLLAPRS